VIVYATQYWLLQRLLVQLDGDNAAGLSYVSAAGIEHVVGGWSKSSESSG